MAIRFSGSGSDYLNYTGGAPVETNVTLTLWAYLAVDRDDYSEIVRFRDGSDGTVWWVGTEGSGTSLTVASSGIGEIGTNSALTVGKWSRIAVTISGTAISLYHATPDGQPTIMTGTRGGSGAARFSIGARGDGSEGFNGRIASVKMYNGILTASEIQQEWSQILPVRTAGLFAAYPLDTGTAEGRIDYSGNGRVPAAGATAVEDGPPIPRQRLIIPPQRRIFSAGAGSSVALDAHGDAASGATGDFGRNRGLAANASASATFSGPPSGVNLCTNPSADIDLTGWSGPLGIGGATNNQTAAVVRATGLSGFPKTTGIKYTGFGFARSAPAAASAGNTYNISYYGFSAVAAQLSTSYIVWYDSSGSDISYVNLGSWPAGGGTTTRQSASATAPANTVGVGIIQDGGTDCILSGVLVEPGTSASTYGDGDTAGWGWDGTAGLSASHAGGGTNLLVSRAITSHADAAAGLTGALGVSRTVSAHADAASGLSGAITLALATAGFSAAASGLAGDVNIARAIAGSSGASSGATGDLTVTGVHTVDLAALAAAADYAVGALVRGRGVAGKATAASYAVGSLTVDGEVSEPDVIVHVLRPTITFHFRAIRPTVQTQQFRAVRPTIIRR